MTTMNEANRTRPQDINDVKWYKKPQVPWGIIIALTLLTAGVIGGWTMRGEAQAKVQSEAATMAASLSKTSK